MVPGQPWRRSSPTSWLTAYRRTHVQEVSPLTPDQVLPKRLAACSSCRALRHRSRSPHQTLPCWRQNTFALGTKKWRRFFRRYPDLLPKQRPRQSPTAAKTSVSGFGLNSPSISGGTWSFRSITFQAWPSSESGEGKIIVLANGSRVHLRINIPNNRSCSGRTKKRAHFSGLNPLCVQWILYPSAHGCPYFGFLFGYRDRLIFLKLRWPFQLCPGATADRHVPMPCS